MSRAHHYHRPNAPDVSGEDPDSDLELDLQELGPHKAGGNNLYDKRHIRTNRRDSPEGNTLIPLRKLQAGGLRVSGRRTRTSNGRYEQENRGADQGGLVQESVDGEDTSENDNNTGDATPLLNPDGQSGSVKPATRMFGGRLHLLHALFMGSGRGRGGLQEHGSRSSYESPTPGSPRSISIGQAPSSRFPPNAVSNAKYTPWSFLPRTLYNEFSFFINLYFLMVALSQTIPPLRIGYLSTYIAPLAFVLTVTLGKEALDDIARRRRDAEANKESYTVLKLKDASRESTLRTKSNGSAWKNAKDNRKRAASAGQRRLDAIEEEEENIGQLSSLKSYIEVDEVLVKSRDLKVGDILKLGKDQRVPADLVILKSYTTKSAAKAAPPSNESQDQSQTDLLAEPTGDPPISDSTAELRGSRQSLSSDKSTPSADGDGVGETFIRTDQLDGETDWKLRLASPLTQALDPRDYLRLTIAAGKPDKKVNEFIGSVELAAGTNSLANGGDQNNHKPQSKDHKISTAPLTIDNTAWANTVLASSATILAVVVYTGGQTRQAMSTSSSRSKTGLLEYEINNLTKILCALTVTLSVVLVALEGFNNRPEQKWYITITRFLILFSTIIPISLRVNLDLGKTVYAWFIERDHDIPGTVVRTSTIPEDLGRIEYLLSDKTGTLTQNGQIHQKSSPVVLLNVSRNGSEKNTRRHSFLCERSNGGSGVIRSAGLFKFFLC